MQSSAEVNLGQRIFMTAAMLFVVISASQSVFASDEPSVAQTQEQQPGELVLVAGATGGTGSEVVKELLASGYRVRAFVRDADKARASLGDHVEYVVGDVRERATIDAALDGVSALISTIGAASSCLSRQWVSRTKIMF